MSIAGCGRVAAFVALLISSACVPQPKQPNGTFWLHEPVFAGAETKQSLLFERGQVSIPNHCPAVNADFVRVGDQLVADATWKSCDGVRGEVRLHGVFDAIDLGTVVGGIEIADQPTIPIVATITSGSSLRIATYNIQMIPSFQNAGTWEINAHRIADRVLASGYDIIAFNEAFDEEIQDILVTDLQAVYPYFVKELDGPSNALSDSGLMLFSRFPFVDLTNTEYQTNQVPTPANPLPYGGQCSGSDCSKVAFWEFHECDYPDCNAAKGVGLVRTRNPETDEIMNVAFTHMQASYAPANYPLEEEDLGDAQGEYWTREQQLLEMQKVIETTLTPLQLQQEATFVIGDLNVDGDLADPVKGWNEVNEENRREYEDYFDSWGDFYVNVLQDGWKFSNAPWNASGSYDRGLTNRSAWGAGSDGARLDYILMNTPATRYCIQHMTLTHNLRWSASSSDYHETGLGPKSVGRGGLRDLSDHYGVAADVNLESAHCSPATADSQDPQPGQLVTLAGTLGRPGEIEWIQFETPGTYSFEMLGDDGVDYRVYQGKDMTTPAPQYKNEVTDVTFAGTLGPPIHFVGEEFHMAEAPFYVRVYHPTRTKTGSYSLRVVKHDCSTQELACALGAGERVARELLPTPPVGQPDEAWFELYTEAIPTGQQQLNFVVGEIEAAQGVFQLDVHGVDDMGILYTVGADLVLDVDPNSASGAGRIEVNSQDGEKTKYFMQVQRLGVPPYAPEELYYIVHWETNLTILFGAAQGGQSLEMRCLEENDGSPDDGDDEVYLDAVTVDGVTIVSGPIDMGDFDAGNARTLEGVIPSPIYFLDDVKIDAWEEDDGAAGDDDWMDATIHTLGPLDVGSFTGSTEFNPENGGAFQVYYNLTHGFDE